MGYGLWVMGYGLWVMGFGLWVVSVMKKNPLTKDLKDKNRNIIYINTY